MGIKDFICERIFNNRSQGLSSAVSERFGISRQAAQKHVKKLVESGVLTMNGSTKAASYTLALLVDEHQVIELAPDVSEDTVWRSFVRPKLDDIPQNVISIPTFAIQGLLCA